MAHNLKRIYKQLSCGLIFIFLTLNISALDIYEYNVSKKPQKIERILAQTEKNFSIVPSNLINKGYLETEKWYKVDLFESNNEDYIFIDNQNLGQIDFYLVKDGKILKYEYSGSERKISNREIQSSYPIFKLPNNISNEKVYIRVKSVEPHNFQLNIYSPNKTFKEIDHHQNWHLIILGILISLILLYALIFKSLGDTSLYFYLSMAIVNLGVVAHLSGFFYDVFWPEVPFLNNYSLVFYAISIYPGGLFAIHFLNLRKNAPFIVKIIYFFMIFHTITVAMVFTNKVQQALISTEIGTLLDLPFALGFATYVYIVKKEKAAIYFIFSWSVLTLGCFTNILQDFGWIVLNPFFRTHIFEICITLEMLFLAVGLSKKIEDIKNHKKQLLEENLKMVENQNQELELLVKARTFELVTQNEEIKSQQEEILALNNQLEDLVEKRTNQLIIRNKRIQEYAFSNSHKVRAPLARILGLCQLASIGEDDKNKLFELIDYSAQELDIIVREMNKILKEED